MSQLVTLSIFIRPTACLNNDLHVRRFFMSHTLLQNSSLISQLYINPRCSLKSCSPFTMIEFELSHLLSQGIILR